MGIKSEVIEKQIVVNDANQHFDGFHVVVHDDDEFGGTYEFTHADDQISAHEAIFSGSVSPMESM